MMFYRGLRLCPRIVQLIDERHLKCSFTEYVPTLNPCYVTTFVWKKFKSTFQLLLNQIGQQDMNLAWACFAVLLFVDDFGVTSFLTTQKHLRLSLFHSVVSGREVQSKTKMSQSEAATTGSESAHLKLKDISIVDEDEKVDLKTEDIGAVVISEYRQCADNATLLACVSGKTKLEHYSIHTFGSNYSLNSDVKYFEV